MSKKAATKKTARRTRRDDIALSDNDNLSRALDAVGAIPDDLRGSDKFLDVVTWNIKWFHDLDGNRVDAICKVLEAINADVFVFQEIRDGTMDTVAERLKERGAGYYVAAHGTTGGDQRVALMWDLDWIRAKDDIQELFGKGQVTTPDGKDAFPRLPLLGNFTGLTNDIEVAFDFQLCGLHLKSQRGGGESQRELASEWLAHWFKAEAPKVDSDIIMLGDWNADVSSDAWNPLRELEKDGTALFEQINDNSSISHFYYKNKHEIGSRLDLVAVSMASSEQLVDKKSKVIRWTSLDELLDQSPSAAQIKEYIKVIGGDQKGRNGISDHMPVITRFYFEQRDLA
jgi:exonuclease III